jgi:hypothetical protein
LVNKNTPFFITGVQRSGTTLLSFLLSNHPDLYMDSYSIAYRLIHCLKTTYQYAQAENLGVSDNTILKRLIQHDYKGRLASLLAIENIEQYDSTQHLIRSSIQQKLRQDKKLCWGDKSPGLQHYLPELLMLVPDAKILHIVRDGRATASSLNRRAHKNIRLSAQAWVDGNLLALQHQQLLGKERFKIVRYEDILEKPEESMRAICTFLELDFHPAVLDPSQHQSTSGDNAYVQEELNPATINTYQQHLSQRQIKAIEQIQGPLLQKMGYQLLQTHAPASFRYLSVWQRIWLNQSTNFKALFRSYEVRMDEWQLVKTKIPLRKRLSFFIRILIADLAARPIFNHFFNSKLKKLPGDDKTNII